MGFLKNGQWVDQWYNTKKTDGRFVRQDPQFRNWITSDGKEGFKAEKGRYHLYISLACPWAHRTSIFRKIKGLDEMISISSPESNQATIDANNPMAQLWNEDI